jgi:hypothetical protein
MVSVGSVQSVYNEGTVSQLFDSYSSWGWGQFVKAEEWEHPLLEVATKQRNEDRAATTSLCVIMICEV